MVGRRSTRAALRGWIALAALGAAAGCTAPRRETPPRSTRAGETVYGVEFQAYPAGTILGARAEIPVAANEVVGVRIAWNRTDRGDFGRHDDEHGGGAGAGAGWRRFARSDRAGWLVGVRADVWWLDVDWEDDPPSADAGDTAVLVFQPAVEAGYRLRLGGSRWCVDVTAALGLELNLASDGEDVGQGPIGLLGAAVCWGL